MHGCSRAAVQQQEAADRCLLTRASMLGARTLRVLIIDCIILQSMVLIVEKLHGCARRSARHHRAAVRGTRLDEAYITCLPPISGHVACGLRSRHRRVHTSVLCRNFPRFGRRHIQRKLVWKTLSQSTTTTQRQPHADTRPPKQSQSRVQGLFMGSSKQCPWMWTFNIKHRRSIWHDTSAPNNPRWHPAATAARASPRNDARGEAADLVTFIRGWERRRAAGAGETCTNSCLVSPDPERLGNRRQNNKRNFR